MSNPFAELFANSIVSPGAMQIFLLLMVLLVIGGTLFDIIHKKSAAYFFENAKKQEANRKREVSSGEKMGLAISTVANEVLTSSEFCNTQRRLSHLMTMYGTIAFIVSTVVLVFGYPASTDAGIWGGLWHLGAISVMVGGYWFWFAIRVDVAAEGTKLTDFRQADLFVVSLLAMTTFGFIWSLTGAMVFYILFMVSALVLFGGIPWSKFAHMFFKPAAAYQKKITKADESRENLPADYDLSDPETQKKFPDVPTYMGENPEYMGLGIKREAPKHY